MQSLEKLTETQTALRSSKQNVQTKLTEARSSKLTARRRSPPSKELPYDDGERQSRLRPHAHPAVPAHCRVHRTVRHNPG
ncbi:hypothetical protein SMICM304S_08206 [Streptomyces microflavus]